MREDVWVLSMHSRKRKEDEVAMGNWKSVGNMQQLLRLIVYLLQR